MSRCFLVMGASGDALHNLVVISLELHVGDSGPLFESAEFRLRIVKLLLEDGIEWGQLGAKIPMGYRA